MSPKLKCYQNSNVTTANNVLKIKFLIKSKIQEIGPDHLGLDLVMFETNLSYVLGEIYPKNAIDTHNHFLINKVREERSIWSHILRLV